ncbi:MAG: ion transporter [Calditrichia bacterium]|nr:ion transporter [Calditrichota bacterium]MCB0267866.1 ion transporter [Calditrichota bacterium]
MKKKLIAPKPKPELYPKENSPGWKIRLHEVIFEADTPAGKWFDLALILAILLSVVVVLLDSVKSVRVEHGELLRNAEWFFTILFTIEYVLRLICVGRPLAYAKSFYGIIDLLAIIPTYLSVIFPGTHFLLVIRLLRILRVFRVLKLVQYMSAATELGAALKASRRKIAVFLYAVMIVVVIVGSLMYLIEGEAAGFTSIPRSIYWAVVTLTTVGYGDIAPQTPLGQFLAVIVMILGYGIIAVPTGIVTSELAHLPRQHEISTQSCPVCSAEGHDADADFCKFCGGKL